MRRTRGTALVTALLIGSLSLAACGKNEDESGSGGNGSDDGNQPESSLKVGVAYDVGGRGDKSFNDSAARGLDKALKEFGFETPKELSAAQDETDPQREARLDLLASDGYDTIVCVGFAYSTALATVAPQYPDVKFVIIDDGSIEEPNVVGYTFKEEEAAFLVGAIAALKSKTGTIGFVGGVKGTLIGKFEAGYTAGAKKVKPDIKVEVSYLSQGNDLSGFRDAAKGRIAANGQYDKGADVIYAAAGLSNDGVIQAGSEQKKLVIGTDSDQWQTASDEAKPFVLSSALKGVDAAVYDFLKSVEDGSFKPGHKILGLKEDGVGYSTSGGQIDDITSQIDDLKQQIVDGSITVPTEPGSG